ncbi:MAG: hypothetical protein IJV37_04490 [Bacteroidales bacterium]|nr:hypothetical protein [Bacteroidales bacterium]
MKSVVNFILVLSALWLAFACTREALPEPEGDALPVRLSIATSETPSTRSIVVGTDESAVTSIWLLCFSQEGICVGCVAGSVSGTSLTASIPRDTRSIHFIGNKDLSAVAESILGMQEEAICRQILVSGPTDRVAFWGYYRGANTNEFRTWLNASPTNTVYLLRDRAKVVKGALSDSNIQSVEWVATNGLDKGYVAPYPFENYYKEDGGSYYGNSAATPYEESGTATYTAAEGDLTNWESNPIYLFEDVGNLDDLSTLVKIILKVTYTDSEVRYHNILLIDDHYIPYTFTRSHTYQLDITQLPKGLGYTSFHAALEGSSFSNNPFVTLAPDDTSVRKGNYTLNIDDPQGAYILYRTGRNKSVQFSYEENGAAEAGRTESDFKVSWVSNEGLTDGTPPILTYNPADGTGAVLFTLNPIDDTMRRGKLLLQDTKHDLSRFVEIYTINQFHFATDPSLTKVDGAQHNGHDVYKLSFALRDDYPLPFYPVDVIFTSMTLKPFSDSSPDTGSGTFSVDAASGTANLSSSQSPDAQGRYFWNYKSEEWGYWFNYSFGAPGHALNIYLEDVTSARGGNFNSVGLILRMPRFGLDNQVYHLDKSS